ncbi:MAG: hypothetical protein RLZZ28_73 [Bacteroidota bacterium]|jgi:short-subunit dehydrogenase
MNIIITGASKGIGKAIAEAFAVAGNTLLICSRNEKSLHDAVTGMQASFPDCNIKAMPADLSDPAAAKAFGHWCLSFGTPDILVNNAGIFESGTIQAEREGQLENLLKVNLYSAYHLTRTVMPAMIEKGRGHIFNICSIASLNAYPNGGSYGISKFALLGFSRNLREELKMKGIKVTAVCPGATMSDSWSGSSISPERIMEAADLAKMIFAAANLSNTAVVEDIVMRPQQGDL